MTDEADDLWSSVQFRYETQYKQAGWEHMPVQLAWTDLPWLMREVAALRARITALEAVVRQVAHFDTANDLVTDDWGSAGYETRLMDPIIDKARALLASDASGDTTAKGV